MRSEADAYTRLIEIIDRLLAPDGCPWDQEQTVLSLSRMLLEEVCETIDTLGDSDPEKLADELGDVFVTAFFMAKAAQKEQRCLWTRPFEKGAEKLVRRHPHIFGDAKKLSSLKDVETQWDRIKATEPEHQHRKSRLDGISRSLPALAMMQKLLAKVARYPEMKEAARTVLDTPLESYKDDVGRRLAKTIFDAEEHGFFAEEALRGFFGKMKEALLEMER